jgi:hypothetical protein
VQHAALTIPLRVAVAREHIGARDSYCPRTLYSTAPAMRTKSGEDDSLGKFRCVPHHDSHTLALHGRSHDHVGHPMAEPVQAGAFQGELDVSLLKQTLRTLGLAPTAGGEETEEGERWHRGADLQASAALLELEVLLGRILGMVSGAVEVVKP